MESVEHLIQAPPEGPEKAKMILVGEALGSEEKIKQRNFVGPAGGRLNKCLEHGNIPRPVLRITNFVKMKPDHNDISPFYRGMTSKEDYDYHTEMGCLTAAIPAGWDTFKMNYYVLTAEGMAWREHLLAELNAHPAQVIVPLGNAPSFALTGRASITKRHGAPVLNEEDLPGKVMLPCLHPSTILHGQYLNNLHITQDLRKAWRMANHGWSLPERQAHTEASFSQIVEFLERMNREPLVCVDVETTEKRVSAIAFASNSREALSIPIKWGRFELEQENVIRERIKDIFENPRVAILGHNVIFDLMWVWKTWDITPQGPFEDTMVLQRIYQPEMPSGLDYLCAVHTMEPYYKEDGKEARHVVDIQKYLEYNAKDVMLPHEILKSLKRQKTMTENHLAVYRRTMDLHHPLLRMSRDGLPTSPDLLEKARIELIANFTELQAELDNIAWLTVFTEYAEPLERDLKVLEIELERLMEKRPKVSAKTGKLLKGEEFIHPITERREAGKAVTACKKELAKFQSTLDKRTGVEMLLNTGSNPQLCWYFYEALGVTPYRNGDGDPTVDDKALQKLARATSSRRAYREASIIQQIRSKRKMIGTYLDIEIDDDGRYRCAYKPKGTVTGRLASEKTPWKTGGNQQNTPQEFMIFVPADLGGFYFEVDKRGAEWVVVAFAADESTMIDVLKKGQDPHGSTAQFMTGLNLEAIKIEAKAIGHTTDSDQIALIRKHLSEGRRYHPVNDHWNGGAKPLDFSEATFMPRTMSFRQMGKKSNHGLNYDEGENVFAETNEIALSEARKMINLYHQVYPRVRRWHSELQFQMRLRPRTVTNCFGREWKFKGYPERELYKKGYAFIPQSTVVDAVNMGLQHVHDHLPRIIPKVQRHDSILCWYSFADLSHFWEDLQVMCEAMTPTMHYKGHDFTIENELKVGSTWGNLEEIDITEAAVEAHFSKLWEVPAA